MIVFPHLFCFFFLKHCIGWVSAITWQRAGEQSWRCCPNVLTMITVNKASVWLILNWACYTLGVPRFSDILPIPSLTYFYTALLFYNHKCKETQTSDNRTTSFLHIVPSIPSSLPAGDSKAYLSGASLVATKYIGTA